MTAESLAIVADVHGNLPQLSRAIDHYLDKRQIVLVGDYVNRGPHSAQVLDVLVALIARRDVFPLRGNHEHALLEYLRTGDLPTFARLGGLPTLASYLRDAGEDPHEALLSAIPATHVDMLSNLATHFERDDVLISHCGVSPRDQTNRSLQDMVLTSHVDLFEPDRPALIKPVVSGHYVQRSQVPYISDTYICIDAGCGTIAGAPLTVLEWPERTIKTFEGS